MIETEALSRAFEKKYENISTVYKLTDSDYETMSEPANWLELCEYEDRPVRLDDFQRATINSYATWNFVVKARQLGFSTFCVAGKAVAKAHMIKNHKSVICSYNLGEAKEKIKIARQIVAGVPASMRKRLIGDSAFELVLSNGSRILSVFSPRGYNNSDIYLDEFAFMADQQAIYRDSTPIIKGARNKDKQIHIGGTPFGKLGLFYDIFAKTGGKFHDYNRFIWYWWDSSFYCKDVKAARFGDMEKGLAPAHMMPTMERVHTYATPDFMEIFENVLIEDFQQEYEAYFCDEAHSYFPYQTIMDRMKWFGDFEKQKETPLPETLEDIRAWTEGKLYAGIDIGRRKNASEFYVFDMRGPREGYSRPKFIQVFQKTLHDVPFRQQEAYFRKFLNMYEAEIGMMQIDENQIGMNLAENLAEDFPYKVSPKKFSMEAKAQMAAITKIFFDDEIIELWPCRETMKHIHSLKKIITSFGNVKYDTDQNEKHHADKLWGIALACDGANSDRGIPFEVITF